MKIFASILISLSLLSPLTVLAQDLGNRKYLEVEGLGIDPFLIEINTQVGSTTTKKIKLTNTTNDSLSFIASINDFVPNGDTGQALFLDSEKESDPRFSLNRWVTITKQPNFTIPPKGNTEVEFSITPPSDAEPGTHYGGILFGRPAGELKDSETGVQQKVGAIILVKLGKSQENVSISNFTVTKKIYQKEIVTFNTLLENEGNVHSKPKGDITIKNIFGKAIAQVPVNRDALIVLPQTQRSFISEWDPKFEIGRFTAEQVLYYGNPKLELHSTVVFWILPFKELGFGLLILLISGIIIYRGIKAYNSYIIKHSR